MRSKRRTDKDDYDIIISDRDESDREGEKSEPVTQTQPLRAKKQGYKSRSYTYVTSRNI